MNVFSNEPQAAYKPSRFNVRCTDKHNNLLLYNTYSGRLVRIPEESKDDAVELVNHPEKNKRLNEELYEHLKEMGYLVSSSTDEFALAAELHERTISGEGHLELIFLPNENCNFRCAYCYESFEKNLMKDWVQEGILNYIDKNIDKYKSLHVEWFGGEPLTAIPVIEHLSTEIIKICKEKKVRYTSSMTTNGYNLTLDTFKKMQSCRIVKFQITIDGLEDTHNAQRKLAGGQGTFERIISNLRNIRDNIKSRTFHIVVRSNISKTMLNELDRFVNFLSGEFFEDSRFSFYWTVVGDYGGDAVKKVMLCDHKEILKPMSAAAESGLNYADIIAPKGNVCYAAKSNSFIVGSDGIIYKCTVAFDLDDNQVGFISKDGSLNIDQRKFDLWVKGHESDHEGCQKCFFRPSCQGASCPLQRLKIGENPCPPQKYYIKEYMKVNSIKKSRVVELNLQNGERANERVSGS